MRWIICRAGQDQASAMRDAREREKERERQGEQSIGKIRGEKRESRRHAEHPS